MISIIVPVYKTKNYLTDCLRSICVQSYRDLEIILVDDGSPDESGWLCDELAKSDERIIVVHKENQGLSSARNAGLKIAKGEYVGFIDSDDTINEDMYNKLLTAIELYHSDIAMCGSNTVDDKLNVLAIDAFEEGRVYSDSSLIEQVVLPLKTAAWNKLFKREILMEKFFPEGRIHGEDLVYLLDVLSPGMTLCTTDYIGYNYFKRGGSITTGSFSMRSFDEVWCKDRALSLIKDKSPQYEVQFKTLSFRARLNLLRKMMKSGNTQLPEYQAYREWLKREASMLPLNKKDRLEYLFFMYFRGIWKKVFVRD